MIPITIASMNAYQQARQAGNNTILGHLAVEMGPFLIAGCALARLPNGELKVWLPSFSRDKRVILRNPQERDRLVKAAADAYRALTGRDPLDTPLATAHPMDENHDPSRDAGTPRGHRR